MDIYSISENGEHLGKVSVSKNVKLRRKNNVCPLNRHIINSYRVIDP